MLARKHRDAGYAGRNAFDAILKALDELVANPTEDGMRRTVEAYPQLLAREGIALAEGLALVQPTPDGRAAAEELALLVKMCAEQGVDAGLAAYKGRVIEIRRRRRLDQERATAQEDAMRPAEDVQIPEWAQKIAGEPIASLRDCLGAMRDEVGPDTGEVRVADALPPFLYRGENGLYPETRSSLSRLARDATMSPRGFEQIVEITEAARSFLVGNWQFTLLEASSYLQHYGLPTDWLDLTDDLAVAASFAGELRIGQVGAVASMPTRLLVERGEVFGLSGRSVAPRPRRQHGWVFSSPEYRDLKQPAAIAALGIRWRLFRMTADDVARCAVDPELLDAHSDPIAGVLQLLIDSGRWSSRVGGRQPKLDDSAAWWLSRRLEPAPFSVIGELDEKGNVRLRAISADEAGISFDRNRGRATNYENWSEKYRPPEEPSAEFRAMVESLTTHELNVLPGDVVRIVSGDGLRALAARDPS